MDEGYKFIRIIGYLGLLPFVAGAIVSTNLISIPSNISEFIKLFSIHYASVILSFMGGVLWGFEISDPKSVSRKMIILILIPPLWAAFAYFLPLRGFILALGFIIIYQLDFIIAKKKKSPYWWLRLRSPLTSFAVIFLAIIAFDE